MKLKRILLSLFFPERCSICGNIKPFLKSYCTKCGIDTQPISNSACVNCGHEKCMCNDSSFIKLPHFTSVYYYRGELKYSILKFKFHSDSSYADIFGLAMAKRMKEIYADTVNYDGVCFVPMDKESERLRGYNQSKLLALKVADELKLPLVSCLKKEEKSAHTQKSLSAKERVDNIKGNFSVSGDINGKVLILCDDIKTTGSTLKECCDTLMKGGAKDVYCLTLALTPYRRYTDIF